MSLVPTARAGRSLATLAVLAYHDVTDDPRASGLQRVSALPYKHPRAAFVRDLDAIATGGRMPVVVDDVRFDVPSSPVMLTFDDGGASAGWIGDELARRGWRGHFFVITSRIGSRPFVDAAAIRTLRAGGHVVGTHSHTHPDIFNRLTRAQMDEEWRVSRDVVEQLLGEPCVSGSIPGGDASLAVFESAAASGLRHLFTSEPWRRSLLVDGCWVHGRVCVKAGTPSSEVAAYARGQKWRRALAVRRAKVLARRMFPGAYSEWTRRVTRPLDDSLA